MAREILDLRRELLELKASMAQRQLDARSLPDPPVPGSRKKTTGLMSM